MGEQETLSIVVALIWRVKHYRGHFSQQTSHTLLICTLGPACTRSARELCSADFVLGTQPETSCLSSLRCFWATIINHHDPIRLFIFLDSSWPGMRESAFFAGRLRPGAAALQLLPDLMVLSPDFLSLPLATADFTVGDIFYDKRRVVIV